MKIDNEVFYSSPAIEILGADMLCGILQASDSTGEGIGDEMTYDGSDSWSY